MVMIMTMMMMVVAIVNCDDILDSDGSSFPTYDLWHTFIKSFQYDELIAVNKTMSRPAIDHNDGLDHPHNNNTRASNMDNSSSAIMSKDDILQQVCDNWYDWRSCIIISGLMSMIMLWALI